VFQDQRLNEWVKDQESSTRWTQKADVGEKIGEKGEPSNCFRYASWGNVINIIKYLNWMIAGTVSQGGASRVQRGGKGERGGLG